MLDTDSIEAAEARLIALKQAKKQADFQSARDTPKDKDIFGVFGEKAPIIPVRQKGKPFPFEAMGNVLGNAAKGIKLKIPTCPLETACLCVLGASSVVAGSIYNLVVERTKIIPLNESYFALGTSGLGKNGALETAMVAVDAFAKTHKRIYRQWLSDKADFKSENPRMKYPEPEPWSGFMRSDNTTTAALEAAMANKPVFSYFSADACVVFGSYSFNKGNSAATGATLSTIWDGLPPITRIRIADKTELEMENRRITTFFMIQPQFGGMLLASKEMQRQGYTARQLVLDPPEVASFNKADRAESDFDGVESLLEPYYAAHSLLLERFSYDDYFELTFGTLGMDYAVYKKLERFDDYCRNELTKGAFKHIPETPLKMPIHVLRLAGAMEIVEHPGSVTVSEETLDRAILLGEFFLGEALRLVGATEDSKTKDDDIHALELWDWIMASPHRREKDGTIKHSAVYMYGPPASRTAKSAMKHCEILQTHGWLELIKNGRSRFWRIAD